MPLQHPWSWSKKCSYGRILPNSLPLPREKTRLMNPKWHIHKSQKIAGLQHHEIFLGAKFTLKKKQLSHIAMASKILHSKDEERQKIVPQSVVTNCSYSPILSHCPTDSHSQRFGLPAISIWFVWSESYDGAGDWSYFKPNLEIETLPGLKHINSSHSYPLFFNQISLPNSILHVDARLSTQSCFQ